MSSPKLAEKSYPITFRAADAKTLGTHIHLRNSVELIGMKRVGISNFLRFFLYHQDIVKTYINSREKHLFIPIDLNDLVERELKPFWILTLKRLADAADNSTASTETKQKISGLFLQSIQLQDKFLTIENIKKAVQLIIEENLIPTIFFLRFDRMRESATPEFFANLQGLIESTNRQLACVFTSERPLDEIRSDVFTREELMTFSHLMYLKPANSKDSRIILDAILARHSGKVDEKTIKSIIRVSGGHMQYLYLADILFNELISKEIDSKVSYSYLHDSFIKDERVRLQSEEIYESFTKSEQSAIRKIVQNKMKSVNPDSKYLIYTGVIDKLAVFSPLFESYLLLHSKVTQETTEFSKKENILYTFLIENIDSICERDSIISAVWPEYEETGVSDWTIDRLVARLRQKLVIQKSPYSIVTVKTRGYKLVQS